MASREGFEEAISAHMAGLSWKLGRKIEWDTEKEMLKPIEGVDFDQVLLANGDWTIKPEEETNYRLTLHIYKLKSGQWDIPQIEFSFIEQYPMFQIGL